MKLQRVFEYLSELPSQRVIPQGVIDEGRIFALGVFENDKQLYGRVIDVVEGLKEHIGQPFELHPWAFVVNLSTAQRDGVSAPMTFLEVVLPQQNGSVFVSSYLALPRRLQLTEHYIFKHTPKGTKITVSSPDSRQTSPEERAGMSHYPLAIALLNTRGCQVDFKRAPNITNAKRKRQGKRPIPAHYDVDAAEYLTALQSVADSTNRDGTHASPIPHLRRAHERVLANGKRIWVSSALVNVRSEGDIAFVERRKAYRRGEKGQKPGD